MRSKSVLTTAFVLVLLTSASFGSQFVSYAASVPEFSLQDVYASIRVQSPVDNESYLGSVIPLSVKIQFSAYAPTKNSGVIPYKDIVCIYSLDGREWKNASFGTIEIVGDIKDPFSDHYWYQIRCTYYAIVQGVLEGKHRMDVTVIPEEINAQRDVFDPNSRNATVTFNVKAAVGLSVLSPQKQTTYNPSVPLSFKTEKSAAWVGYSLDGQANVTATGNTTITGVSKGIHTLTVYANDTEGNTDTSEAVTFNVVLSPTPSPSPTATISLSPSPSTTPQPTASPELQPANFQTELILTAVAISAVVAIVAVLVVFRRRKR